MSIYAAAPESAAPAFPMQPVDSAGGTQDAPVTTAAGGGGLVRQQSRVPAELQESLSQLTRTFTDTRKDNPADCCKKGEKGCCRHLCNIFCFPCSYYPRASACCGFASLMLMFILISGAITALFNLDVLLSAAAMQFKQEHPNGLSGGDIRVSAGYTEDEREELTQQLGCDLPDIGCTTVEWFPCELYTQQPDRRSRDEIAPGTSSREAECAMVPVPLLYTEDGEDASPGETIDLFVKRLRGSSAGENRAPKALWMLQGGPGAPSVAMEDMMEAVFVEQAGMMDVYTFDHRGTGRSTPMTCTAAQSLTTNSAQGTSLSFREVEHCFAAFNAGFSTPNAHVGFSVTNAAHDLKRSIALFNSNQLTHVYGVSYGTFLVSRYLQITSLSPQATSAVLDGVVSTSGEPDAVDGTGRLTFDKWSIGFEQVGKDFFDACGGDTFCSSYLGTGDQPYNTVVDLHDKLDAGHCPLLADIGVTSDQVGSICGLMLLFPKLRELLPAFIFRLNRCDKHDRGFVLTIMRALSGAGSSASLSPDMPADMNELLYNNIKYSEMWDEYVTLGTMRQRDAASHFAAASLSDYLLAKRYEGFSVTHTEGQWLVGPYPVETPYTYPRDRYYDGFPETKSNVLVMNGLLDPQTPYRYGKTQFEGITVSGGAHKWQADFPGSAHCTVFDSPVTTKPAWQKSVGLLGEGGLPCGMQTLLAFINDPAVDPVLTANCLANMKPVGFGQDGAANAAELLHYPELDMSDPFDGVSDVTQRLIDMEAMAQQGLWFAFLIFVLPCCGFFMGFVDLRMKTKARVCCF